MKKSQLRHIIREMIVSELTMVGPQTPSDEVTSIAKSERTSPNTVKDAIKQAKQTQTSVGVAESIRKDKLDYMISTIETVWKMGRGNNSINYESLAKSIIQDLDERYSENLQELEKNGLVQEMATFYKVKDKEGFKKALKKYKELKGDKYDKNALGQLLVALDKDGEVNVKDLAKEKGKDTATWNNPTTRASLEKDGGEFTDYIEAGKGEKETSKKEEPKKKETPKKKEAPKSKPKKQKDEDEDEEVEDNWNKSSDDDETEDEEKIDKKAQSAAKKGGSNVTKLQRVTTQLKDLEKEMKELAGKWKSSEGTEKEKFLNQLKEKTKVKKELEKEQDKLADLIG